MINEAVQRLLNNEVVGIPTETVYGLAGRIDSDIALKKIFSTKKRPFFDPLIVHVASIDQAKTLVKAWPRSADVLAKKFWPGPLTIVLEKNEMISDLITAGLESVGIRMPNHPLTLEIIKKLNIPVAAPSANKFGKTSPTKAIHVQSEFQNENVFVVDGGDCQVGLESTVLVLKENGQNVSYKILRLGMISEKMICDTLLENHFLVEAIADFSDRLAPGNMQFHYMPKVPLILLSDRLKIEEQLIEIKARFATFDTTDKNFEFAIPKKIENFAEVVLNPDPAIAARELYSKLRDTADDNLDFIYFVIRPNHQSIEFSPIMDKLKKASSFTL